MKSDELLAQIMAKHEVILPRGAERNDGKRIGIDFGGPGQNHMLTDTIARGDRYAPIHVDDDTIEGVQIKFAEAVLAAARELADD